MNSLYT